MCKLAFRVSVQREINRLDQRPNTDIITGEPVLGDFLRLHEIKLVLLFTFQIFYLLSDNFLLVTLKL
jgi:hypothetical protein